MLRDVVAAFLDTVTEREFDAPLLALLSARGFDDVHFLHGAFEFGKDFIAKGMKPPDCDVGAGDPSTWTRHQFALQSKSGDLGLSEWRSVRKQLDEARLDDLAHPAFDTSLPRAGVVVLTGRLTGGAPLEAQSYRSAERSKSRPDFEVWDRDTLLEWLADAPEVGLAGTSDGPLLAVAGAIDQTTVTASALEQHSRVWLPPTPGSLSAATQQRGALAVLERRSSVEAAVLVNRLRRSGRLDLAALVGLHLLRAAWCQVLSRDEAPDSERPPQVVAAIRLFVGCATELLSQVQHVADNPVNLLRATAGSAFPHAAYPVACARIAEILGLLGLLTVDVTPSDPLRDILPDSSTIEDTVSALVRQPGTAHPIGDSFAVSIIPSALLVARRNPALVREFLTRTVVWVADRYDKEYGAIGLAATGATPTEDVDYLLGGPYDNGPRRRSSSYLATVLTDLAAVVPEGAGLYADIINEFLAVDAFPLLLSADERRAQWRPDGAGVRLMHVDYRDPLPADGVATSHFDNPAPPVPAWDAVALASTARNRHSIAAVRMLLKQQAC